MKNITLWAMGWVLGSFLVKESLSMLRNYWSRKEVRIIFLIPDFAWTVRWREGSS